MIQRSPPLPTYTPLTALLPYPSPLPHTLRKTTSDEACRGLELEVTRKIVALEQSLSEVREEGRKAVEAVRQAVAAKAGLSDLEVNCLSGHLLPI